MENLFYNNIAQRDQNLLVNGAQGWISQNNTIETSYNPIGDKSANYLNINTTSYLLSEPSTSYSNIYINSQLPLETNSGNQFHNNLEEGSWVENNDSLNNPSFYLFTSDSLRKKKKNFDKISKHSTANKILSDTIFVNSNLNNLPELNSEIEVKDKHWNLKRKLNRTMLTKKKNVEEHQMSRDEKKAVGLHIPLTVSEIINLPMDEFNDLLSKHDLSEDQLVLCRDIRRRGKNKVAARNCRKRKIDQIRQLEDDVTKIKSKKIQLIAEHNGLKAKKRQWENVTSRLEQFILKEIGHDPDSWNIKINNQHQIIIIPKVS